MYITIMKEPCTNKKWLLRVAVTGWLVAGLCILILGLLIGKRYISNLQFIQEKQWTQMVAERIASVSAEQWGDLRPLLIFAGDSHIEMGDWYNLFHGQISVRNYGLSRARVRDVIELVAAISDDQATGIVLLCGTNDLGSGEPIQQTIADYKALLSIAKIRCPSARVIVVSIPPVRAIPGDLSAIELNKRIAHFNHDLKLLCASVNIPYLDILSTISRNRSSLDEDLTVDGLHWNRQGYQSVATFLLNWIKNNEP